MPVIVSRDQSILEMAKINSEQDMLFLSKTWVALLRRKIGGKKATGVLLAYFKWLFY